MSSKSLFGFEQESLIRKTRQGEKNRHFIKMQAVILEVLSNYKQIEDLSKADQDFINSKLGFDENFYVQIKSGLHFFILTETNEYAIIPCPISEDEVRFNYGSDGNIIGRFLEIETLNKDIHSIERRNVRFLNNEKDNLEDNDRYLPLTIGNMFGSYSDSKAKMNRFKVNLRTGEGVFNV